MEIKSGRQGLERPDQRRTLDSGAPRLSTFKRRGGGGPESRAHLSNGYDRSTWINGAQGDSRPPPRLSTFKRKRGGGPESRTHLSDGYDRSTRINSAQAIQTSSVFLRLINMGPPFLSCHLAICSPPHHAMRFDPFSPSSSPDICPSPLSWSMGSLPHLIIGSPPAMCPAPFHVSLPLKRAHYISSPAPFAYCLSPCVFPCNLSHASSLHITPS
jgi:hypothetical protein